MPGAGGRRRRAAVPGWKECGGRRAGARAALGWAGRAPPSPPPLPPSLPRLQGAERRGGHGRSMHATDQPLACAHSCFAPVDCRSLACWMWDPSGLPANTPTSPVRGLLRGVRRGWCWRRAARALTQPGLAPPRRVQPSTLGSLLTWLGCSSRSTKSEAHTRAGARSLACQASGRDGDAHAVRLPPSPPPSRQVQTRCRLERARAVCLPACPPAPPFACPFVPSRSTALARSSTANAFCKPGMQRRAPGDARPLAPFTQTGH